MSSLDARHLTAVIGSEIHGQSLRPPVPERTVDEIRRLLVERHVLFFPDAGLSQPSDLVDLGREFGELTPAHPFIPPVDPELPELYIVDTGAAQDEHIFGSAGGRAWSGDKLWNNQWHADSTYFENPAAVTMLHAVQVPDFGGDTLWSSAEAVYDSLHPRVQVLLDGLSAVHDGRELVATLRGSFGSGSWDGVPVDGVEPVAHPLVRVDPVTGRRGVFLNPTLVRRIAELSPHESDAVVRLVRDHQLIPENTVRYRWQDGVVALFDNVATVHYAASDYVGKRRIMHRVMLRGGPIVGVTGRDSVDASTLLAPS